MEKTKEEIMREQLDSLYSKIDEGQELLPYEQMAFDIYSWLLDDSDQPAID